MRKLFSCMMAALMLLGAVSFALAEEVKDLDITLDFAFGQRTGTYTGALKDGLPDGQGAFTNIVDGEVLWIHTGSWVAGHMEGYGSRAYPQDHDTVFEGTFSRDVMNGEGTYTLYGVMIESGTYVDGFLAHGDVFTDAGTLYFSGDFEDGFMVESAEDRAKRIDGFLAQATEYDLDQVWNRYDSLVGANFYFVGTIDNVWARESASFQDFGVNVAGDADQWVSVFGYLSVGETKIAEGEENVMILGVLLPKYEWTDDNGALRQRPNFQYVAVERLDFSPKALQNGSKGEEVKLLQTRLKELGYYSGKVDGRFGKGTAASVSAFQEGFGLTADGIASLRTLYALYTQSRSAAA